MFVVLFGILFRFFDREFDVELDGAIIKFLSGVCIECVLTKTRQNQGFQRKPPPNYLIAAIPLKVEKSIVFKHFDTKKKHATVILVKGI